MVETGGFTDCSRADNVVSFDVCAPVDEQLGDLFVAIAHSEMKGRDFVFGSLCSHLRTTPQQEPCNSSVAFGNTRGVVLRSPSYLWLGHSLHCQGGDGRQVRVRRMRQVQGVSFHASHLRHF